MSISLLFAVDLLCFMEGVKYGRDGFVYKKDKRRKSSTVHENTDVSPHCPQAAAVHSIARLCSNIIGAVKVFINKKIRKTPGCVAFLWVFKSIYNLY